MAYVECPECKDIHSIPLEAVDGMKMFKPGTGKLAYVSDLVKEGCMIKVTCAECLIPKLDKNMFNFRG